ncbi:MAG: XRE family transcriptional regulator [Spirochaetes bacterium]|nr:MAG: XRE family transcriptional regulator [Spirochaetota bacterium]
MIPYIRRKKNIKQYDMAKALRVSPSYLCKIEKGIQEPSDKFRQACAKYLGVTAISLFPAAIDDAKIRTINKSFSNKLWSVRKEKRIKQYELAKQLRCSPSYLSKVEKGLQEPTAQFKKTCAKILKTKESELFPS